MDYPLSGIEETTGTHYITLAFKVLRAEIVPGEKKKKIKKVKRKRIRKKKVKRAKRKKGFTMQISG